MKEKIIWKTAVPILNFEKLLSCLYIAAYRENTEIISTVLMDIASFVLGIYSLDRYFLK